MNFLYFLLFLGGLSSWDVLAKGAEKSLTEKGQQKTEAPLVTVEEAWMRITHQGKNAAVFMTLKVPQGQKDVLMGGKYPFAKQVELHTHKHDKGIVQMRPVEDMEIQGVRVLKPGGDHVMLMGLTKPVKVGQTIEVTLQFKESGQIIVPVRVIAAGGFCARGGIHKPH